MTKNNSIVSQESIQDVNSVAMVLLAMSEHYKLPEAVKLVIMDLNGHAENLQCSAISNEYVYKLGVTAL